MNDKPVGLVLSGGGAKGAFQVGALKALKLFGFYDRIAVISGTSIGSINGAAIASHISLTTLENYWLDNIEKIPSSNWINFTSSLLGILDNWQWMIWDEPFPLKPFLKRDVLESTLTKLFPSNWPDDAPELYASTLQCLAKDTIEVFDSSSYCLRQFNIGNELNPKRRIMKILASAAIPWAFAPVSIDGRKYVDGGWTKMGGDNIPITPILKNRPDIKTIFVISCNAAESTVPPQCRPKGVEIIEIHPKLPLPGILDSWIESLPEPINPEILKIWSGTLAFEKAFAQQFIRCGFQIASKILMNYLINSAKLDW